MPSNPLKTFCLQGTVDGTINVLVPRPEVGLLVAHVLAGRNLRIGGSRASGKSTLVAMLGARLREQGWRTCFLDMAGQVGPFDDSDRWPDALLTELESDLGLSPPPTRTANPGARLRDGLLAAATANAAPLFLVLDEFDAVVDNPRLANFFGVLRGLQNLKASDPRARNLVVAMVGVRPPEDLVVGHAPAGHLPFTPIWLDNYPWSEEMIDALADGFPPALAARRELARLAAEASGGHPWVCSWLCQRILERKLTQPEDVRYFVPEEVSHHRRYAGGLLFENVDAYLRGFGPSAHHAAVSVYAEILRDPGSIPEDPDNRAHALLRWSGLVRVDGEGILRPRGLFYEHYFDLKWARRRLAELVQDLPKRIPSTGAKAADRRILVINTGGTIGMVERDGKVVRANRDEELGELYEDLGKVCKNVSFESFDPRDSADIGPPYWQKLGEMILRHHRNYDGIVVAHGTDTMAYTASALAFAFGDRLPFSLVFTGAQTTVDVLHGDARTNLHRAVRVALERIPEVLIVFGEYAFRACRAQKKDDARFDAFESPAAGPLAYVTEFVEVQHGSLRNPVGSGRPLSSPFVRFADGILQVSQCPGAFSAFYEAALEATDPRTGRRRCRGIVLQTLGAGNVPSLEPYSLEPLIVEAIRRQIPVVLTSQYPISGRDFTRYAPAAKAIEAGAQPIGNMTVAAVVAKLSWVLAQVDDEEDRGRLRAEDRVRKVSEMMLTNFIGEVNAVTVTEAT